MFCPRCAQQQISDETHYCSACGFLLSDVAEALENDGLVERNVAENTRDLKRSVSFGLLAIILSSIFFILSLIFGTPEPSFFVQFNLLVGLLVFLFGLAWIGYAFWLRPEKTLARAEKHINNERVLAAGSKKKGLPGSMQEYVSPIKGLQTNELEGIPSVTEGTTKLLEQDEKTSGA